MKYIYFMKEGAFLFVQIISFSRFQQAHDNCIPFIIFSAGYWHMDCPMKKKKSSPQAIDIWMGTCTAFVFAALVEFTFVNYTWRWAKRKIYIKILYNLVQYIENKCKNIPNSCDSWQHKKHIKIYKNKWKIQKNRTRGKLLGIPTGLEAASNENLLQVKY